jgi:SWI/SNF-related matrix-associated actin-dependent regulator of chromatin subfamily A member 5
VEEKIVERAARKLKVDHLIMQKGTYNRQMEKSQSVNNLSGNEVLSMIKFGAQEIISTANAEITEANIDSILEHSLRKTKEISQQLASIEDKFNLNNVSLTGDDPDARQNSLYTFEGLDYKKKGAEAEPNFLNEFIDVGRRERIAQNYNVDSYYRQAMSTSANGAPG